jgi:hypothetical protein
VGRRARAGRRAPKSLEAGIIAYIEDTRHPPKFPKKPASPPLAYALIELAKMYGQDPLVWPYDHDATAVRRLLNILSVAGKEQAYHDRVGPDSKRLGD